MRYAFVAEHRGQFSVRAMCRCLRIQPSGFYAWLKNPLSKRAQEDRRQTELIRKAWDESGRVYGYRKLHDDLLDQGESICPNRVARLTKLAGIKAQIGYKRRPSNYGGKAPEKMCRNAPRNCTCAVSNACREILDKRQRPGLDLAGQEAELSRDPASTVLVGLEVGRL